ncbi:MAG: Lrp/AsnC family transcriptional regulator [Candidatus Diapherotrites archaeon]|nr:Lrp/AsnC family transcriptional regulator [Candidatus Diapherotrites archaeon]
MERGEILATGLEKRVLKSAYIGGIQRGKTKFHERLKLKKSTVDYIMKKLEGEKFFSGTNYKLNLAGLGSGKAGWVFVTVNRMNFDEQMFLEKIFEFPQVHMIAYITGNYDFAIKIMGGNFESLNEFITNIEKTFGDILEDVHINFIKKEYKRHYFSVECGVSEIVELSSLDKSIVIEKMQTPSISLTELSEKCNVHRNTISNRWKRLWDKKVIIKEVPVLTPKGYEEIGLGMKAVIVIRSAPGKEEELVKILVKEKEIQDVFTTLSNEIIVVTRTKDSNSLANLHVVLPEKINRLIRKTNTFIILKNKTRPDLMAIHEY